MRLAVAVEAETMSVLAGDSRGEIVLDIADVARVSSIDNTFAVGLWTPFNVWIC